MTQFGRLKVELTGWDGAPGVNFYNFCAPAHTDITNEQCADFWDAIKASLTAIGAGAWAAGVVSTVSREITIHEVDTGELIGVEVVDESPFSITGTGDSQLSRATQVGMQWHTADIRNGRRVAGRTFLGPMSTACFAGTGQTSSSVRTDFPEAFEGAYDPLAARLIVWSRPTTIGGSDGQYADVVSATVAARPFVLRSRRD